MKASPVHSLWSAYRDARRGDTPAIHALRHVKQERARRALLEPFSNYPPGLLGLDAAWGTWVDAKAGIAYAIKVEADGQLDDDCYPRFPNPTPSTFHAFCRGAQFLSESGEHCSYEARQHFEDSLSYWRDTAKAGRSASYESAVASTLAYVRPADSERTAWASEWSCYVLVNNSWQPVAPVDSLGGIDCEDYAHDHAPFEHGLTQLIEETRETALAHRLAKAFADAN